MVTVLVVLNTGRAQVAPQLRGDATRIAEAAESLVKPIRRRLEKSRSGYQQVEVRTPTRVTAFDLFYDYRPLW